MKLYPADGAGHNKLSVACFMTYERMARTGAREASLASLGLADIAMLEAPSAQAERIALAGIGADRLNGDSSPCIDAFGGARRPMWHRPDMLDSA